MTLLLIFGIIIDNFRIFSNEKNENNSEIPSSKIDIGETPMESKFVLEAGVVSDIVKLVIKQYNNTCGSAMVANAMKNAQTIQWCINILKIRYPLIKQLRFFESESDYAMTFKSLGSDYPRFLICKNCTGLDVKAFFHWARSAGVTYKEIVYIYVKYKSPAKFKRPADALAEDEGLFKIIKACLIEELAIKSHSEKPKRDLKPGRNEIQKDDTRSVKIREAQLAEAFNNALKLHPGCSVQELAKYLEQAGCHINLKALKAYPKLVVLADECHSADQIDGLDEAGSVIEKALEDLFARGGGYTSAHELFGVVQVGLDDFFYNNDDFNTEREVFDLAVYFFEKMKLHGKSYLFYNNTHIWRERPDYDLADAGLLVHWARMNGGVMTKELGYEKLRARGSMSDAQVASIFSQAITKAIDKSKFWIIDEDEYLLKEGHELTQDSISTLKRLLDELLSIELEDPGIDFIPMGDISEDFFAELPPLSLSQKWTPCLLQSVIDDYSEELGYKTLPRANIREQHAAIIPNTSEHQDYSDLVRTMIKTVYRQPLKEFYIYDLHRFLQKMGLWPADTRCSSFLRTSLKKNINFQFTDEDNLVVV